MNLIEVLINLVTFIGGVLISPYVVKFMFEKIIQNTGGTHYGRKCEKEK